MFRELLSIFSGESPIQSLAAKFKEMMKLTESMTQTAGRIFFAERRDPEERSSLYKQDVRVNKLERSVRKRVVAHLSLAGNTLDVPYCLLLMSLVKDVERLGDYAKNLAEVEDLHDGAFPDDDIVQELREVRSWVEATFLEATAVFETSDEERAKSLLRQGRAISHRCDALVGRIARSEYDAGTATAAVLGARFYKRVAGHVLNILSSVVMPLHKIDYYDEDLIGPNEEPEE